MNLINSIFTIQNDKENTNSYILKSSKEQKCNPICQQQKTFQMKLMQ
jgi:hypothetical protein